MSSIERLREYKAQKGPHGESTKANIKYWQERASENSDSHSHWAAGKTSTNGKPTKDLDLPKLPSTDARTVAKENLNHSGDSSFMPGVRRTTK
jgi:hypothetical protein